MQTIKKVILVMICFVVLLTSFVQSSFAVSSSDYELPFMAPYEDMVDVLDPYAPMALVEAQYTYFPATDFGFNNLNYEDSSFLYYEALPYGKDTIVLGFRKAGAVVYLLFFNAKSTTLFNLTWNNNNGYCGFEYNSLSPVYRIAYSLKYGYPVSFNGYTGLTSSPASQTGAGATYYYMGYTFIEGDFHVSITPNYENVGSFGWVKTYQGDEYEPMLGLDFGIAEYPSYATKDQLLQNSLIDEGNKNTKGIWDSIKELPSKIADSIKGFFTSLGDRISDFFSSLGDRISGFFESLKNYLLYFQQTKPEHVNPFADVLTDVNLFFDNQMSDVADFKNSLTTTLNNVVAYIRTGSGAVDTILTAIPTLSAFVTFFIALCVVRKVVGR